MNWKKVSEYPLPEGDGNKKFLVEYVSSFTGKKEMDILQYPKPLYKNNKPLYWTELELPPEEEIKKEPEIALWSVWEALANGSLCVLKDIQNGYYYLYNIESPHLSVKTNSLVYYKPRPDLEVRAPFITTYKSIRSNENYKLHESFLTLKETQQYYGITCYKWPASLSQMIVVPKEKK